MHINNKSRRVKESWRNIPPVCVPTDNLFSVVSNSDNFTSLSYWWSSWSNTWITFQGLNDFSLDSFRTTLMIGGVPWIRLQCNPNFLTILKLSKRSHKFQRSTMVMHPVTCTNRTTRFVCPTQLRAMYHIILHLVRQRTSVDQFHIGGNFHPGDTWFGQKTGGHSRPTTMQASITDEI
jgi:hypothetical protein